MNHRIVLICLLALLGLSVVPVAPVQAECRVLSSPETYTAGQVVRDVCDVHGTRLTQNVDANGNAVGSPGGTANAAAPTLAEGMLYGFFLDLLGNLRTTLGTLISGEDQTNNLLMTSGGAVRQTSVGSGLAYAADCSADPTTYGTGCTPAAYVVVPVGSKTFTATLKSSTSADTLVAQTIYIYGGDTSNFTSDTATLVCTISFSAATQSLLVGFTQSCPVATGNWLYYGAMTFGTDAGVAHATRANVTSAVTVKY